MFKFTVVLFCSFTCFNITAKTDQAEVLYLGNTGLLVDYQDQQVLFDPFFHNHFDTYHLVPEKLRHAIFESKPPFDSVEMILISHAHADHFDAADVVKYLTDRPATQLVAPTQAVDQLKKLPGFERIVSQIQSIGLAYGDQPVEFKTKGLVVDAVRIPHAGWPSRADVSNLVYRVTLNDDVTVMHMGDADPDDVHFIPQASYWEKQQTDHAFPPYWFMLSPGGQSILADRINAKHSTGVHVPVVVPVALEKAGVNFFAEPGKTLIIKNNH